MRQCLIYFGTHTAVYSKNPFTPLLHVCVCVCLCVCMCVFVYVWDCVSVCQSVCLYARSCVCVRAYVGYVWGCVCEWESVCVCTCRAYMHRTLCHRVLDRKWVNYCIKSLLLQYVGLVISLSLSASVCICRPFLLLSYVNENRPTMCINLFMVKRVGYVFNILDKKILT